MCLVRVRANVRTAMRLFRVCTCVAVITWLTADSVRQSLDRKPGLEQCPAREGRHSTHATAPSAQ